MSLRILFADDSMTAQSMGKKILTEAGYEVVAVSNGAAAVKKIAEQKPDIIILDVYMPGYSGLEVCEKVRGSMDTLKTPVLLTVGKMEPFRPEDGNRVRADGVIVKPFEASDLLAVVKKLEERVSRPAPRVEQPVLVDHGAAAASETAVETPEPHYAAPAHSTVEVPDHMAGSSAFGDLLNTEPVAANSAPVVAEAVAPPPPLTQRASVPEYEIPVSWRDEPEPAARVETPAPFPAAAEPAIRAVPVSAEAAEPEVMVPPPPPPPVPELVTAPAAKAEESVEPDAFEAVQSAVDAPVVTAPEPPSLSSDHASFSGARPLRIPVYHEPEAPANSYEFMPTSTPAASEIEIPREPHLQETAEETTRSTVADAVEPGLMTTRQQFEWEQDHQAVIEAADLAPLQTGELRPVEVEPANVHLQDIPAEIAAHAPEATTVEATPQIESPSPVETDPSSALERVAPPSPPPPIMEFSETKLSEDDFEARVAAAMAAYKAAGPDAPLGGYDEPEPEAVPNEAAPEPSDQEPVVAEHESTAEAPREVISASPLRETPAEPAYSVPTFEYRPPVSAVRDREAAPAVMPQPMDEATGIEIRPIDVSAAIHQASAPVVESVVATAAAAAGTGADHAAISQAVHRVMEKLKPELVQEILRELKPKS